MGKRRWIGMGTNKNGGIIEFYGRVAPGVWSGVEMRKYLGTHESSSESREIGMRPGTL
jgi:hypothetical protein